MVRHAGSHPKGRQRTDLETKSSGNQKPAPADTRDGVGILDELPQAPLPAAHVVGVGVVVLIDNEVVAEAEVHPIDIGPADRDGDPGVPWLGLP